METLALMLFSSTMASGHTCRSSASLVTRRPACSTSIRSVSNVLRRRGHLNAIPEQPALGSIEPEGSELVDASGAAHRGSSLDSIANNQPSVSAAYNRDVF